MTEIVRYVFVDGQRVAINSRDPARAVSPRTWHTGGVGPVTTTTGTDTTPVTTEMYMAEVDVRENCTITGVAVLMGSASGGNVQISLYDISGYPIVAAQTASTAQSVTAGYQSFDLAAPYTALPGTLYVGVQFNNVAARFRSHILGVFKGGKITGGTYGSFPNVTLPSGFTTGLAPIACLY